MLQGKGRGISRKNKKKKINKDEGEDLGYAKNKEKIGVIDQSAKGERVKR